MSCKTGSIIAKIFAHEHDSSLLTISPTISSNVFLKNDEDIHTNQIVYKMSLQSRQEIYEITIGDALKHSYEAYHVNLPHSHLTIRTCKDYRDVLIMREVIFGINQNKFLCYDFTDACISDCTLETRSRFTKYKYRRMDTPDIMIAKGDSSIIKILRNNNKIIAHAKRMYVHSCCNIIIFSTEQT